MRSFRVVFVLAILFSSIAAITSDLYLPSVPAIAIDLHTSLNMVQFTITTFVFGMALARLLFGIASDAYGRKGPIVFGLALASVGGVLTVIAPNIYCLLFGRFLQGFGVGGSNVLARVLLRDYVEGDRLAQYNSYYSMANISLIAMAPLLGGYLQHYYGWRISLILLMCFAVVALLAAIFILKETNMHRSKEHIRWPVFSNNMRMLLTNKNYLTYAALLFLSFGVFSSWITASPVLIQHVLGYSPIVFGWIAFSVGASYFFGALVNGLFVRRFGAFKMIEKGILFLLFSGIFLLVMIYWHIFNIGVLIAPIIVCFFGLAMVTPNTFAGGMSPFPKLAGMAVAMLGSVQMIGGVVGSGFISIMPEINQLPLGIFFVTFGALAILLAKSILEPQCVIDADIN